MIMVLNDINNPTLSRHIIALLALRRLRSSATGHQSEIIDIDPTQQEPRSKPMPQDVSYSHERSVEFIKPAMLKTRIRSNRRINVATTPLY